MPDLRDKPNNGLIAAVFCAIVGLIFYAGWVVH